MYANIGTSAGSLSVIWSNTGYPYPVLPESVSVGPSGKLFVVQDGLVSTYSLSDANFNLLGPSLLGIGFVPVTSVNRGRKIIKKSLSYSLIRT